jgi:hypothetical protein
MPIPAMLEFRLVPRPWVPRLLGASGSRVAVRCGPLPVSARATTGPLAAFPALVRALGDVRHAPVILRERILPRSEMNRRRAETSL